MGKYPSPTYQVLKKDHRFELRHYETFYTVSAPDTSLSGKNAFRQLFSYIKGLNKENKQLSMTVPVINDLKEQPTLEFVIPKEHYDDIPSPMDSELTIKKHSAKNVAVYRFSGFSSKRKIEKIKEKLLTKINQEGFNPEEDIILARYNPPIVPPFFRKNELLIEIKD